MTAAEWHNRRLLERLDCDDEDDCEGVWKVSQRVLNLSILYVIDRHQYINIISTNSKQI